MNEPVAVPYVSRQVADAACPHHRTAFDNESYCKEENCLNYMAASAVRKTPDEWSVIDGVTVHDIDGWREAVMMPVGPHLAPQPWDVPINRAEWEARLSVSSIIRQPPKTKVVQKWADTAMFASEPLDARTGPSVHLLHANNDPLGSIAAMALMYKGIVVRDLADVTDQQRREMFDQINQTKLKAPFEAVKFHWMVEGVTRSLTHQMVRQRTAVFAQESLRFAVVEDGFAKRTSLPPSLAGTIPLTEWAKEMTEEDGSPKSQEYMERNTSELQNLRNEWDSEVDRTGRVYQNMVNAGMPAEDARGLLPHNITTRLNYVTDLRNFQDHAGARLCTQAQFEWRALWIAFVQELRRYGRTVTYKTTVPDLDIKPDRPSAWQFDLIADAFRPVCYLTGKCEFAAQDLDRKCSIRDRVDANHAAGRPSSEWHLPLYRAKGDQGEALLVAGEIDPREWLADPGAAR